MDIRYEIQLVGGPFDGEPGLAWVDDGDHETPGRIHVGKCPGAGACGLTRCFKGHVGYWTPEEVAPAKCVTYERQDVHVIRDAHDDLSGRAIYALGGLLDPQSFRGHELVGAGSGGGDVLARAVAFAEALDAYTSWPLYRWGSGA